MFGFNLIVSFRFLSREVLVHQTVSLQTRR